MCGIIGYVGPRAAKDVVVEGLRRMEYRGYDSSGIAVVDEGSLHVRKKAGKISNLDAELALAPLPTTHIGIGHTRWATHGGPTDSNAHPHVSSNGRVALVHNGIIENFASLRAEAQEAAVLHSHAVDAHQASGLRMLDSVRALDGATSLPEVLDALATGASKEAGRAAMLVVKGDRLIGWRTIGFGALDHEPRAIESSTSDVGALAAAVNTGRPAVTGTGSVLAAPSFSDAPADRPGLAVPLLVAGRPVAVLYADQASASATASWTSPVEVLVRHAARCLEGLAVQRATAGRATGTARVAASA